MKIVESLLGVEVADDGFARNQLFERDANLDTLWRDARFTALLRKPGKQWEHYTTIL